MAYKRDRLAPPVSCLSVCLPARFSSLAGLSVLPVCIFCLPGCPPCLLSVRLACLHVLCVGMHACLFVGFEVRRRPPKPSLPEKQKPAA